MADLKCGVENCSYNADRCCCKGDIMVGGRHAKNEADTCCESFVNKTADNASNACHPQRTISIDCEASKCVYNSDYKCTADHVDIRGNNACDCDATNCATFKERQK